MFKRIVNTVCLFLIVLNLSSQNYPKDYFRAPLDIKLYLSGTFGELRSNHFHSGMDFKTGGAIGKNVYAIADGYVSRIKVSPWGYGKAIYIQHPNGYTSVYGHLDKYSPRIDSIVKAEQYRRESFAMDYFPEKNTITIKKSEIIGLSGNSGSSGGPHLHFEIRNANQEPINPMHFGITVKDNISPVVQKLFIYNLKKDNDSEKKDITLVYSNGILIPKYHDTIAVSEEFFIGVNSFDRLNGAPNQNGIYSMSIFVDDEKSFEFVADKFNFNETRYLNAYIDYEYFKKHRSRIQKSIILPNNKLSMYNSVKNRGIILMEEKAKKVNIIISDFAGNKSEIVFWAKKDNNSGNSVSTVNNGILFKYNEENIYKTDNCIFIIPKNALYENIFFHFQLSNREKGAFSTTYQIHDDGTPLHKYCTVKIRPDSSLTNSLKSKAFIASIDSKGRKYYEGGNWENDFMVTKTRSFGKYYISVDTIAPNISAINVYDGKNIKALSNFRFKITDDFSGINIIEARLNGEWILIDYDPKRNLIVYEFDEKLKAGPNTLKLTITDNCNNSNSVEYKIYN